MVKRLQSWNWAQHITNAIWIIVLLVGVWWAGINQQGDLEASTRAHEAEYQVKFEFMDEWRAANTLAHKEITQQLHAVQLEVVKIATDVKYLRKNGYRGGQ